MNFQTVKMDMFTAPLDSWLLSSVNCKGIWGGGVAFFMKEKYPDSYILYRDYCKSLSDEKLIGTSQIIDTTKPHFKSKSPRRIVNLFTSRAFGMYKDRVDQILEQTGDALDDMFCKFLDSPEYGYGKMTELKIVSNKFNSGLFNVPWEETEKVLLSEIDRFKDVLNINWTVSDWN